LSITRDVNGDLTNRLTLSSTGAVDVVPIAATADEIIVNLTRRAPGVGFYGVEEVEISGATPSLPRVLTPQGETSQLSPGSVSYSPLHVADGDFGTVWASGAESGADIFLPLPAGSSVDEIQFQWVCLTLAGVGRLGPAADYEVHVRDRTTGEFVPVPLVREIRGATGAETVRFGSAQSFTNVVTDQLRVRLTARESGVDHYCLREITLLRNSGVVPLRTPSVLAGIGGGFYAMSAFDGAPGTAWASITQGSASAVWAQGSNMKFTHLKVVGFGTKSGKECFPFYIVGPAYNPSARIGNIVVEDCLVTDPAMNNTDGLTGIHMSGAGVNSISNAVIRRCVVRGVNSHFVYSHAYSALHIENSVAEDCSDGATYEPEAGVSFPQPPILIRSNSFINVGTGIGILTHPRSIYNSMVILDNDIALTTSEGWGFVNYDSAEIGPTGILTNLVCLNNVVRYLDWSPRPARAEGGLHYSNIRHAVYGNNLVALGTRNDIRIRNCPAGLIYPPGEIVDCDHPATGIPPDPPYSPPCLDVLPAGYRRAWFNNRDGEGRLLDVRIRNYNVEQLAGQQQWLED
jgi:hypothetical protein